MQIRFQLVYNLTSSMATIEPTNYALHLRVDSSMIFHPCFILLLGNIFCLLVFKLALSTEVQAFCEFDWAGANGIYVLYCAAFCSALAWIIEMRIGTPVTGSTPAEEGKEEEKRKMEEKKAERKKEQEEQRLMELECERNVARKKLSLERLERRAVVRMQRVAVAGWLAQEQEWILEREKRSLERTERELERTQFRERMQRMERMVEQLKEENTALKEAQRQSEAPQEPGRGWMGDLRPRVPEMESTRWWGRQEAIFNKD